MIDPNSGLEEWYAKQILVPFGEYVPLPFSLIPGVTRMVGPVGSFTSGQAFHSFKASGDDNRSFNIFSLVCYEDIFPGLARKIQADSCICICYNK